MERVVAASVGAACLDQAHLGVSLGAAKSRAADDVSDACTAGVVGTFSAAPLDAASGACRRVGVACGKPGAPPVQLATLTSEVRDANFAVSANCRS